MLTQRLAAGLAVVLACTLAGCGGGGTPPMPTRTLAITDQTASPGSSITVPVTVTNAAGIAGIDITLTYNPSLLTATDAVTTALTSGFLVQRNVTSGQIQISMANVTGIASGSGALVNITFSVSSGATSGQSCPLTMTSHSLYDQYAGAVAHQVQNGVFRVQ